MFLFADNKLKLDDPDLDVLVPKIKFSVFIIL